MNIKLGEKIKQLRQRDGRKQEDLANALGVSPQAISRWEASGGYPDMELIPAIANYFNVSIDELFGYSKDREEKLKSILSKAEKAMAEKALFTPVAKPFLPYLAKAALQREVIIPSPVKTIEAIHNAIRNTLAGMVPTKLIATIGRIAITANANDATTSCLISRG